MLVRDDLMQVGPVSALSRELTAIPGVGTRELDDGYLVELPRNTWDLAPIRECFAVPASPPTALLGPEANGLRDYQEAGVEFILRNEHVLLGDVMGVGKTVQAATAARIKQNRSHGSAKGPILILAPKFLRATWLAELERVGFVTDSETQFCALSGRTLDPKKGGFKKGADWYFCHYDVIETWWSYLWPMRPVAAIVDEAHFLKNSRTKRAKGVQLAAAACPMRILLTGTPILNRIGEMWNLLNLTTGKWSWGTPSRFRQRYAGATHDGWGLRDGSPTHTDELQQRLQTCYLRRTLDDVQVELPAITRQLVEVDLDERAWKRYAECFDGRDPRSIVQAILDRRLSTETLGWLNAARKVTSKAKLEATSGELAAALDQGEDVVVFSWERDTAHRLVRGVEDRPASAVTGAQNQDTRDSLIDSFVRHGGVLSATYGALGVGVNLQHARVVILHDLDWTPATMLQAEARVYRPGGGHCAIISKWMVARDTLDAFIARMVIDKAATIGAAIGDLQPSVLGETLADVAADSDVRLEAEDMIRRWQKWRMR
jgi:hypothetical protein